MRFDALLQRPILKEARGNIKELSVVTEAVRYRKLQALLSYPAFQDQPQYIAFLRERADSLIAAGCVALGGAQRWVAASSGGRSASNDNVAAGSQRGRRWR